MRQTAIFVDAGYLFAAGSALLTGSKKPRSSCRLDAKKALNALRTKAKGVEPDARVLRTYWYDGIRPNSGPTPEQATLGEEHFLKLRLGMMNSLGQQKGVDSLIVTDLIELSRNQAIHDALLLAGDEDIRVGVQVAQSFGVRVHLLSVEPSRGNVSPHLRQEMDSLTELTKADIASFLVCEDVPLSSSTPTVSVHEKAQTTKNGQIVPDLKKIVEGIFERFSPTDIEQFRIALTSTSSLPREIDAPILGQARHDFGRDLTIEEKREVRKISRAKLQNN